MKHNPGSPVALLWSYCIIHGTLKGAVLFPYVILSHRQYTLSASRAYRMAIHQTSSGPLLVPLLFASYACILSHLISYVVTKSSIPSFQYSNIPPALDSFCTIWNKILFSFLLHGLDPGSIRTSILQVIPNPPACSMQSGRSIYITISW